MPASVEDEDDGATLITYADERLLVFSDIRPAKHAWQILGHLLAEIDVRRVREFSAPARAAETAPREAVPARPPPTVVAAADAAAEVRRRGGRIYLWQTPVGGGFALDKLATDPPAEDVAFETLHGDGFDVLVDERLEPTSELRIALRRFPRRRLEVLWDGARWGRRGTFVEPDTGQSVPELQLPDF